MSAFHIATKGTPHEAVASIARGKTVEQLAQGIVSDDLNRLISNFDQSDLFSHLAGKGEDVRPVPYVGWYWRSVDFFEPRGVTIADGPNGVGVCQSNKWDYDDRDLTDDEQATFLNLVWQAKVANSRGGNLAEINRETAEALIRAGEFIESLAVTA
jgi:hypothetical protein